jgi:hypothetical protein
MQGLDNNNNAYRTDGCTPQGLEQGISWRSFEQAERIDQREEVYPPAHMLQLEKKDIVSDVVRSPDRPVFSHSVFVTL